MRRNVASVDGPGQPCGSRDISVNEIFGFDHQALEGYPNYEDSLRKVLTEEIKSLKKKSSLVPDAPLPPNLQEERRKEAERAKAEAAKTERMAAADARKAKAKARPQSTGPSTARGKKAALEREVAAKGKQYADAAKKIVVTSSKCADLGQAVLRN